MISTALDGMRCASSHGDAPLVSDYPTACARVAEFAGMDVPAWAIADVLAATRTRRPCCAAVAYADYLLSAAARAYIPPAVHAWSFEVWSPDDAYARPVGRTRAVRAFTPHAARSIARLMIDPGHRTGAGRHESAHCCATEES